MGPEARFEKQFKKDIENLGGICLKINSVGGGKNDRLVLMPKNWTYWVELKRPDRKGIVSPLQQNWHKKLKKLGHLNFIIDSEWSKRSFLLRIKIDQTL